MGYYRGKKRITNTDLLTIMVSIGLQVSFISPILFFSLLFLPHTESFTSSIQAQKFEETFVGLMGLSITYFFFGLLYFPLIAVIFFIAKGIIRNPLLNILIVWLLIGITLVALYTLFLQYFIPFVVFGYPVVLIGACLAGVLSWVKFRKIEYRAE